MSFAFTSSIFLIIGTAFSNDLSKYPKEKILGIMHDKEGITFQVASGGCTQKSDFDFLVIERFLPTVYLVRIKQDSCKAIVHHGVEIRFSYRELGYSHFYVGNEINSFVAPRIHISQIEAPQIKTSTAPRYCSGFLQDDKNKKIELTLANDSYDIGSYVLEIHAEKNRMGGSSYSGLISGGVGFGTWWMNLAIGSHGKRTGVLTFSFTIPNIDLHGTPHHYEKKYDVTCNN